MISASSEQCVPLRLVRFSAAMRSRAPAHTRSRRAITPMLWLEDVGVSRSENWDHCAVALLSLPPAQFVFQGKKTLQYYSGYSIHRILKYCLKSIVCDVRTYFCLSGIQKCIFMLQYDIDTTGKYTLCFEILSYLYDTIFRYLCVHISWILFFG